MTSANTPHRATTPGTPGNLISGAGPTNTPMGGMRLMRRPSAHRPRATTAPGWAHPYVTGPWSPVLYADGGDDPTPTPPGGTAQDPPKPSPPPVAREFTQEDLERVAAREKAQGKRSALKEFAEQHGFNSPDDAAAFIAAAREAQQAQMSEQEKREQALAEKERKLAEREAAATTRLREATRKAVLVSLGATGVDLEDAAALLRVDDDADEAAVTEAAQKLKERRPELFGVARPADTTPASTALPPAPGGSPAGGPPPRTPAAKSDTKSRAHALAVKMGYAKPDAA